MMPHFPLRQQSSHCAAYSAFSTGYCGASDSRIEGDFSTGWAFYRSGVLGNGRFLYNLSQFRRIIMKMAQLFEEKPTQWGLRGDPYLWQELKETLQDVDVPHTVAELKKLLESTYETLTGKPLLEEAYVHIERFSHGGMSSGMISPEFWREKGMPHLLQQYERLK
jgi:hypothetical protein